MQDRPLFAGIDWSWQHHAVCVVDDQGRRVQQLTVAPSRSGLGTLTRTLGRLAVRRVAIERGDGPVVEQLLADGFEVVVISPRQVRSLRARYGTAGNKTTGWTSWCSPMRYGPTPAAGSRCNRTRRPRSRCGCWSGLAATWSPTASPSTTSCWPSCNSTSLVRSDGSPGSISRSAWRSYAGSRPKPTRPGSPKPAWPPGSRPTATAAGTPQASSSTICDRPPKHDRQPQPQRSAD